MKKCILVISLVLISSTLFAALDWVGESAAYISTNGGGSNWYNCSTNWPVTNNFIGYDFGTITSITLGGECQSYDTNGDVAKIGYKIDNNSVNYINLPYLEPAGNNDKWQNMGSNEISLAGLSAGDHTLAIWFFVTDNDADLSIYDSNGGDNYVASFHLDSDVPLPVSLTSFTAEAVNGTVHVTWITESETENAAFRVYRDGEMIAGLEGAGTTSEPQDYMFTDNHVIPGKTYRYVLADVDYQGKETKHPEVEVKVEVEEAAGTDFTIGSAYPNPFNPVTVVPLNLAKDAVVTATLYDISGRPVQELQNGVLAAGSHDLKIDGANLSTGIYLVKIRINDALHVRKIALMK